MVDPASTKLNLSLESPYSICNPPLHKPPCSTNHPMTTPAMVFSSVIKLIIISLGVFWSVSFLVSRLFIFYEAYTDYVRTLKDEQWLLLQCASPEFYTNLRTHTDLCNNVRRNAERSAFLIALNAVAQTAHLCGRYSCVESLAFLSTSAGWPVLIAAVAVVLLAPAVLIKIVRGVVAGGVDGCDDSNRVIPQYVDHPLRHRQAYQYSKLA